MLVSNLSGLAASLVTRLVGYGNSILCWIWISKWNGAQWPLGWYIWIKCLLSLRTLPIIWRWMYTSNILNSIIPPYADYDNFSPAFLFWFNMVTSSGGTRYARVQLLLACEPSLRNVTVPSKYTKGIRFTFGPWEKQEGMEHGAEHDIRHIAITFWIVLIFILTLFFCEVAARSDSVLLVASLRVIWWVGVIMQYCAGSSSRTSWHGCHWLGKHRVELVGRQPPISFLFSTLRLRMCFSDALWAHACTAINWGMSIKAVGR